MTFPGFGDTYEAAYKQATDLAAQFFGPSPHRPTDACGEMAGTFAGRPKYRIEVEFVADKPPSPHQPTTATVKDNNNHD